MTITRTELWKRVAGDCYSPREWDSMTIGEMEAGIRDAFKNGEGSCSISRKYPMDIVTRVREEFVAPTTAPEPKGTTAGNDVQRPKYWNH